ncbi:MAG: hypothetical protein M3081_13435 [Gemmatimonadota bacterium]|nr:hypothetical protein [Gemmatimonadota bacterium]
MADSGLFVLDASRVLFAKFGVLKSARVRNLGAEYIVGAGTPSTPQLHRLSVVSRFPGGMSRENLDALLRAYSQERVETLR